MSHDNWYSMPQDVNQWQTFVLSNLARKVPEIPQYIAGIEFSKMDPVLGDADGLVYLIGGMAGIPITVRQNKMAPLDVMVSKKEDFYPVSEVFLQKIYADNVIGTPSNDPLYKDESEKDGPAQRIQYYNTVSPHGSAAKMASLAPYATKVSLRDTIEKSASLLSFFNKQMPELLDVLYSAEPEPEVVKEASYDTEDVDLLYMYKKDDTYYLNGDPVSAKTAGDLASTFELTDSQSLALVNGADIYVDKREKTAGILMENDLLSTPGGIVGTDTGAPYMATVVDVLGKQHKGILSYVFDPSKKQKTRARVDSGVNEVLRSNKSTHRGYIFIADEGYAMQGDILTLNKVSVNMNHVCEVSTPSAPEVGMFGVTMSKRGVTAPFTVSSVSNFGPVTYITTSDAVMNGSNAEVEITANCKFYEIPDTRFDLTTTIKDVMATAEGKNVSVGLDGEGKIVLASEALTYNEGIYKLMSKYATSYEDAKKIVETVQNEGRLSFKIASTVAKAPANRAPAAKSADQNSNGVPNFEPVKQEDLDDVAAINDPSLMDAYITGKLTDVNTAGREQVMQASDAIVGAIKAIGKMLFLIRVGKVDYVKETDAQLALDKLSDVAKSLGVASIQVQ